MKQYQLAHRRDLSGITLRSDVEQPKIKSPTEVLVKLKALSLNARDLQVATDNYPAPHPIPENLVPVSDAAGEVVEVGERVTDWKKGDRVCTLVMQGFQQGEDLPFQSMLRSLGGAVHGCASEYFVIEQSELVRIPDSLSFEEGSALPIAATTAWNSLYGHHPKLRPGETVLCMGTGGVSLFAAQIALMAGAKIILTSSSDVKLDRARKLLEPLLPRTGKADGRIQTINYSTHQDWDKEVEKLTNGKKVDFVIEIGGRGTIAKSIRSTRQGGLVAISGYLSDYDKLSDQVVQEDIAKQILYSAANVRGNFVSSKAGFIEMNAALEASDVHPIIDKVFDFEQLKEAFEYVESGSHFGKVVIAVRD